MQEIIVDGITEDDIKIIREGIDFICVSPDKIDFLTKLTPVIAKLDQLLHYFETNKVN